ncbi:MAG: N-acetyl-gamma-glutamyl-phosphate reductase [Rikenellaceae bacterium]|jgi:N-acetyl-gamma-glutamyl-phosphate reductase|nr:N-acetyl-gamma-glutamyl-phosphate reductase [Rikenellaceae bacterium]
MNRNKIRAGIIGGAGYTGGETARLLLNHPGVELRMVHSTSNAGNLLSAVHTDLLGDTDMRFTGGEPNFDGLDVVFLCMGHGDSRKFMESTVVPARIKVIDLSQDFRLATTSALAASSASGARQFVYGLPELNKDKIVTADSIANPGCFATCLQLALLPLAAEGLIKSDVHVSAITGSTGAGQKLAATSHFTWRANNMSTYKEFDHQHLGEIGESLHALQPTMDAAIDFIPWRGDFTRGIIASIYTECDLSPEQARELYGAYYGDAAFTFLAPGGVDLKQVVNTNKCLLALEKKGGKLLITSVIDNLLKGASGQAVHNMNLMFGLDEKEGLRLKATAF